MTDIPKSCTSERATHILIKVYKYYLHVYLNDNKKSIVNKVYSKNMTVSVEYTTI